MPVVWIPSLMRGLTGGRESVTVQAATVGEAVDALERLFPGMKARLCDEHGLRRGISVTVDSEVTPLGLRRPLSADSEVHFLPAISGG
jgi:molybdopterin synthase sulfur carrier subunit